MNKYQQDIANLKSALSAHMEDSNLSRPLNEVLNDFEKLIDMHDIDYVIIQKQNQEIAELKKALLLACEKISFGAETEEAETQEEAQDNYIYMKYTRPKELMEKYIRKAKK